MMYINPFVTFNESPESVQLFVGFLIAVIFLVLGVLALAEIVYNRMNLSKKGQQDEKEPDEKTAHVLQKERDGE